MIIEKCNNRPAWRLQTAQNTEVDDNLNDDNEEENSVQKFNQLNEIKRVIGRKFNMQSNDHRVRFKNIYTLKAEEFLLKVHQILNQIFNDVLGTSGDNNSKIRVFMDADGLSNPYNGPFVNGPPSNRRWRSAD